MSESIKDKFLKEHALNDDDLEKVSGGFTGNEGSARDVYEYLCQNPNCIGHTISFGADMNKKRCHLCGIGTIVQVAMN